MRGNGFKGTEGRLRLDTRRNSACEGGEAWHREAGDISSLEVFKASFDGTLSKLLQWKVSLPKDGL